MPPRRPADRLRSVDPAAGTHLPDDQAPSDPPAAPEQPTAPPAAAQRPRTFRRTVDLDADAHAALSAWCVAMATELRHPVTGQDVLRALVHELVNGEGNLDLLIRADVNIAYNQRAAARRAQRDDSA